MVAVSLSHQWRSSLTGSVDCAAPGRLVPDRSIAGASGLMRSFPTGSAEEERSFQTIRVSRTAWRQDNATASLDGPALHSRTLPGYGTPCAELCCR